MFKYNVIIYEETIMLAQVFRKNKVNLLYGESGCGKTVSAIKALNNEGIEPILFDFDDNDSPEQNECSYLHIDGYKALADKNMTIPVDKVIIVDTWHTFKSAGGEISLLDRMAEHNTVIIIDHNRDLSGKRDIPMMDEALVNHLGSKLWLERSMNKAGTHHNLHIKKCRGYKGGTPIANWMREEPTLNILKEN